MRVLVLGGGGREHALCWSIAKSAALTKLWCAPGNAGISQVAECISLNADDPKSVVGFCQTEQVDLLVVGPEAPLAAGVSDAARAADIAVFGPSKAAAQLETSKAFTKRICDASDAPTARYGYFETLDTAQAHIRAHGAPIVIKADGLAAGKGVVVAETLDDALDAVADVFDGPGGGAVVLEEMLEGPEVSFFVLSDGETVVPLAAAQDHKRALDGDQGPNTGGMGAYSPAPIFTSEIEARTMNEIVRPVLNEMRKRDMPYSGVLYVGLMLTAQGPKLIEFNARFGDPECQCILPRLKSDGLALLDACARGKLAETAAPEFGEDACMTVVMAARGYPGSYEKGDPITDIDRAEAVEGVTVFHAGTRFEKNVVVSNGGRVLGVTAIAPDLRTARDHAYRAASEIRWNTGFLRSDIGWRAIKDG